MKNAIIYAKEAFLEDYDTLFCEARIDAVSLLKVFPDAKITVSVSSSALSSLPKKEGALKLVNTLMSVMKITTFKSDDVFIDFAANKYVWNGRELHVTPMERVALYYALIMGVTNHNVYLLLGNLRSRVGELFLHGVLDVNGKRID